MEEIMEILRTMQAELQATPPEMKAELIAEWDAATDRVMAKWDSRLGEVKACEGTTKACREATEVCEERTEACLEEKKSAPKETETVAEPEEIPERAMEQETVEAAEDRTGDLRLAVRCRRRLKTRTKRNGQLRQDCSATVGWPTHRFVPALRKGELRKGPGKKCRSGIRG
jgi:hypothetical protein